MNKRGYSKHFRKQMVFNMLFVSITILVIGCIAIFITAEISVAQYHRDMEAKAQLVSDYLASTLDSLNSIPLQVSLFKWVSEFDNLQDWRSELASTELRDSISDTVRLKAISPIIRNISIVLPASDLVVSDHGVQELDQFWLNTFSTPLNLSSPLLSQRNYARFSFRDSIPSAGNTALFVKPVSAERHGNLFVFIDKVRVLYEITRIIGNDAVTVHIYDDSQSEIFTTVTSTLNLSQMEEFSVENHLDLYHIGVDGYEWTVALVVPSAMRTSYLLKNIAIALLLVFCLELASIPASYFLAVRNYKPIKRLMNLRGNENMEYEAFLNAIEVAFNSEDQRKRNMALYQPLLRTSLLNELASANADTKRITDALLDIGVELPFPYLMMAAFVPADTGRIPDCSSEDVREYLYSQRDDVAIYLLNGAQTALLHVRDELITNQDESLYISLSGIYCFPEDTRKAADEIRRCILYRNTDEGCTVLEASQLPAENRIADFSALDAIRNAIKGGKTRECRTLVGDFFYSNIQGAELISYIRQIHARLLKTFTEIAREDQINPAGLEEFEAWDINGSDSITRLMEDSLDIALELAEEENGMKELSSRKELEALLSYLDEHIYDPYLSLSLIADEFKTSESRVSRQIKLLTGSNFLDYVNKKRIARAREILVDNLEININAVALQVGYSNDITFRRLFKKFNGVSPGEYRTLKTQQ